MSQGQPRRPQEAGQDQLRGGRGQEPIKYGDIFNVSAELSRKPVAPEDANMMQSAETMLFGQTQKGGPAAAMQSAASLNERAGLVGHRDVSDTAATQGVAVAETDIPGARIITERIGGQVVRQFVEPTPVQGIDVTGVAQNAITIGQAIEATALTVSAGGKPVDQSDAAAIQAAEVRATGSDVIVPGGLAAAAQSAASYNAALSGDEEKIKFNAVLSGAAARLPADKVVTRAGAEGVVSAELRNNPNLATHPGGVAASITAAARMNENVNVGPLTCS